VVKTLAKEDLGRDVDEVLNEARVLYDLDHPSIIRLLDCGYTVAAEKARPYFVMNYFKGVTLEEYVQKHGPLSPQDLMAVARQIAKGLQAAHDKGILHRDVKPANILVLKDDNSWKVKIIDFGLALKQERIASAASTNRQSKTIMGSSIAGTLDYAAPEQMGRQSEAIGLYSDIYGFAKTCSFALFQTTQPLFKHWQSLPLPLAQLLEKCLEEDPKKRPQTFAAVLKALSGSKGKHRGPPEGPKSSASATAYTIAVTALVPIGYLVAIIIWFSTRNFEDAVLTSLGFLAIFWLSAFITSLVGMYRMWRVVARAKEDPTPKAAVGLLCVPFFNFYWIFRAIPGLSAALERDLHERDPSGDHWTGWIIGLTACILFCIPYLNLASPIVFVIWLNLANSATNRLIRLRDGGRQVSGQRPPEDDGSFPAAEEARGKGEDASLWFSLAGIGTLAVMAGVLGLFMSRVFRGSDSLDEMVLNLLIGVGLPGGAAACHFLASGSLKHFRGKAKVITAIVFGFVLSLLCAFGTIMFGVGLTQSRSPKAVFFLLLLVTMATSVVNFLAAKRGILVLGNPAVRAEFDRPANTGPEPRPVFSKEQVIRLACGLGVWFFFVLLLSYATWPRGA